MPKTKTEIKEEWDLWGSEKPWYCPQCDSLLSIKDNPECDGTDPFIPETEWNKHPCEKASDSISFEKFAEIINRWFENVETASDKTKYLQYEEEELKVAPASFKEVKLTKELKKILEEQLNEKMVTGEEEPEE